MVECSIVSFTANVFGGGVEGRTAARGCSPEVVAHPWASEAAVRCHRAPFKLVQKMTFFLNYLVPELLEDQALSARTLC